MVVFSDILQKAERFCAYQERCKSDVVHKLKTLQLSDGQIDEVVGYLEANNFLNEGRFVEVFVRSKVKQLWGRQKIMASLAAKRIPAALVQQYCSEIDEEQYDGHLKLAISKWQKTHAKAENSREKLIRHLLSKGYSYSEIIKNLP